MSDVLRTVFMGTPELAVPCLEVLARQTRVQTVVTQPDAAAGRGRRPRPPPVKEAAERLGLPVWQPTNINATADADQLAEADYFIVFAYGALLKQPLLDLPRRACINIHASLLPRWRGASPLQAAIRAGDQATGVSIMRMVKRLDAGPVYLRRSLALPADATLPWLHDQMADLAPTALAAFLQNHDSLTAETQDEAAVTTCGKLTPADGQIDWRLPVSAIDAQVRAYTPLPGCWSPDADGQRYRIEAVTPLVDQPGTDLVPGTVIHRGRELLVHCSDGLCRIDRLQAPGKRRMDVADFLNGHRPPGRFLVEALTSE